MQEIACTSECEAAVATAVTDITVGVQQLIDTVQRARESGIDGMYGNVTMSG